MRGAAALCRQAHRSILGNRQDGFRCQTHRSFPVLGAGATCLGAQPIALVFLMMDAVPCRRVMDCLDAPHSPLEREQASQLTSNPGLTPSYSVLLWSSEIQGSGCREDQGRGSAAAPLARRRKSCELRQVLACTCCSPFASCCACCTHS
jgi:hypothetical protein